MLFPSRVHTLREVSDLEDSPSCSQHTWTLCSGFRFTAGDEVLLFLNDSTGENGAQEYAVMAEDGRQLETITFGWCDQDQATELIRRVLAGDIEPMGTYPLRIDSNPNHVCHLCR